MDNPTNNGYSFQLPLFDFHDPRPSFFSEDEMLSSGPSAFQRLQGKVGHCDRHTYSCHEEDAYGSDEGAALQGAQSGLTEERTEKTNPKHKAFCGRPVVFTGKRLDWAYAAFLLASKEPELPRSQCLCRNFE